MPTTVSMPQLGETVTEGTVLRWMKQVGDGVAEDEPLVEISTDKVDTEVPSPVAGIVSDILVGEGETIKVGTAMVVIGQDGNGTVVGDGESSATGPASPPPVTATADPAPPPSRPAPAPPIRSRPRARRGTGQFLSPVVRRLAREHGVDPTAVKGSGKDGRVTRNDVLAYIDQMQAGRGASAAPVPEEKRPEPTPEVRRSGDALPPKPSGTPKEEAATEPSRKLSRLRVRIADNMIKSRRTATHVWTSMEVDYEAVERVRRANRETFKKREGFSLTYLPFIAKATIDALREFPIVNSSFDLEARTATHYSNINLGVAIDLNQEGLMVATIKDADDFTLRGMARKIRDVAQRARKGRVGPDDVSGSTFTITNPGPYGSFMSAPIINVPNVAILSTDTVAKRPKVVTTADGQDVIAIRHIGYLGLSWDHRAFDGSTAVLFLRRIRDNLESWDWDQHLT